MPRLECPKEENILRAILTAHWDNQKDQYSSSLFKGRDISVSRLTVLGMAELFEIFHQELDTRNKHVEKAGEINIGRLQAIGQDYQPPNRLTVEEDPTPRNRAHAVIPQKIGRGLAFEIIKALTIHPDPLILQPNPH